MMVLYQSLVLGILAAVVLGGVVILGYRALGGLLHGPGYVWQQKASTRDWCVGRG